jgi:hypothetical protein
VADDPRSCEEEARQERQTDSEAAQPASADS